MASGRLRGHRAARPGPGLVLADPGRDDRHRARLPGHPPGAGPAGPHPRGLGRRLWLADGPIWADSRAWWHSERRLHAARPAAGRHEHLPDAEIHWPSIEGSPYAGQVWAVEVELTPKPVARTSAIMAGLLSPMRYATVVYLTAPAARSVVLRAAASLPPGEQNQVAIRDLPATAFTPEAVRPEAAR